MSKAYLEGQKGARTFGQNLPQSFMYLNESFLMKRVEAELCFHEIIIENKHQNVDGRSLELLQVLLKKGV